MPDPILVTSVTVYEPVPDEDPRVVCWIAICLWDAVKVRGMKLIRGADDRVRLYWPQRKDRSGNLRPTTHAVSKSIHVAIETQVLAAYRAHLQSRLTSSHPHHGTYEAVPKEDAHVA